MKKAILITALTLCFSVVTVNAKSVTKSNVDITTTLRFKVNSFCVSIAKGDYETVKKLIERGADVNEKSNGMTPAMYAAKYNRTKILKLLIAKGANLKVRSDKKMTAMEYAQLHGANEAAVIIKENLTKKKKKK